MTMDQLREAISNPPCSPFSICMADGRRIRVRSREFVFLPPTAQRTFVVATGDEAYRVIDPLLVTSLDFNGHPEPAEPR